MYKKYVPWLAKLTSGRMYFLRLCHPEIPWLLDFHSRDFLSTPVGNDVLISSNVLTSAEELLMVRASLPCQ